MLLRFEADDPGLFWTWRGEGSEGREERGGGVGGLDYSAPFRGALVHQGTGSEEHETGHDALLMGEERRVRRLHVRRRVHHICCHTHVVHLPHPGDRMPHPGRGCVRGGGGGSRHRDEGIGRWSASGWQETAANRGHQPEWQERLKSSVAERQAGGQAARQKRRQREWRRVLDCTCRCAMALNDA